MIIVRVRYGFKGHLFEKSDGTSVRIDSEWQSFEDGELTDKTLAHWDLEIGDSQQWQSAKVEIAAASSVPEPYASLEECFSIDEDPFSESAEVEPDALAENVEKAAPKPRAPRAKRTTRARKPRS